MKPELEINVGMKVDERTARFALLLLEIYCNDNGCIPLGNRQADGTIRFCFEKDYGKEIEER